jgi:hypothetical protein
MRRLIEHFRLPESLAQFTCEENAPLRQGFFKFGDDAICFGQCSSGRVAASVADSLPDARAGVRLDGGRCHLPFNPDQIVDNLLLERYPVRAAEPHLLALLRSMYYTVRPLLPVSVRSHLQRFYLSGWEKIPFPSWPVDCTVERFLERCLALTMKAQNLSAMPFIWFWPRGYDSCAMVTHDVEAHAGRDFCSTLMDLDDSCGVKSAFQVIPEQRYAISEAFLAEIRDRGFEINVHDLNHDGKLFLNERQFMKRVVHINRYGKQFGSAGFRAGVMYRNQRWAHALNFEYDMSVPNAAHLEPQRGGCCTVFPYFIDKLLELPLTTTQDYALFHFLGEYSQKLWHWQIDMIRQRHGLITVLAHPDYITGQRETEVYLELLRYLDLLRAEKRLWIAKPREVNDWWRLRSQLRLVRDGSGWRIEGAGCERAQLAYAQLDGDLITYRAEGAGLPPVERMADHAAVVVAAGGGEVCAPHRSPSVPASARRGAEGTSQLDGKSD